MRNMIKVSVHNGFPDDPWAIMTKNVLCREISIRELQFQADKVFKSRSSESLGKLLKLCSGGIFDKSIDSGLWMITSSTSMNYTSKREFATLFPSVNEWLVVTLSLFPFAIQKCRNYLLPDKQSLTNLPLRCLDWEPREVRLPTHHSINL